MNERNLQILRSAKSVFAKYGVAKTTMNDIAREAGVARQTVYNAFNGKTELLRAAVRLNIEETLEQVKDEWKTASSLERKLDIFFERGPLYWFEMVRNSPEIADLIEGLHATASEELAYAALSWKSEIGKQLSDSGVTCVDPKIDLEDIADFFYHASLNAKHDAVDLENLRQRLRVIKSATLALLE